MSLPQTSDALRNEARVVRDGAERAARTMEAAVDSVRQAHARIKGLETEIEQLKDFTKPSAYERDTIENMRGDLKAGRKIMGSDAEVALRVLDRMARASQQGTQPTESK